MNPSSDTKIHAPDNPTDPTAGLLGLAGRCETFHVEVRKLCHPYTPISESAHRELEQAPFDYYLTENKQVVTFGAADGGFALMPLNPEDSLPIIESNRLRIDERQSASLQLDEDNDQFNEFSERWCSECEQVTSTTWEPMATVSFVNGVAVYSPEDPAQAELNYPRCEECGSDLE